MADKLVMMYWDCSSCDSRGIEYFCVMTFLDDNKKKNEKKTFSISEEIYNKLEKDKKVMCKYWEDTIQEVLE